MTAKEVFDQQNGDVTKAWYQEMNQKGIPGQLAVALFRAQKRSTAAKKYRGGRYRRDAYDVKNWSLSEVVRILSMVEGFFEWGWGHDPKAAGFEHVLYVVLPQGQVSFHSADRLTGPEFGKMWDGEHKSQERILAYCDSVGNHPVESVVLKPPEPPKPPANPWDAMRKQFVQ